MNNKHLAALALIVSMSAACAAQSEQDHGSAESYLSECGDDGKVAPGPGPSPIPSPVPLCTPIAGPSGGAGIGMANPASVYCSALGGAAEGDTCTFADGTTCEQWAFFRGECGQAHSFCNRNGGQVSAQTEDAGGFTATYALCTLPSGVSCKEQDFAATCTCE